MSLHQIATILGAFGFILSTLFIYVLKVNRVKIIADRIKQEIISIAEIPDERIKKEWLGVYAYISILALIILALLDIAPIWKRKKHITLRKYILIIAEAILLIPFVLIMSALVSLAEIIDKSLISVFRKMKGNDAVTGFIIFVGVCCIAASIVIHILIAF